MEFDINKYFDSCHNYLTECQAKLVQHQRAFYLKEEERIAAQMESEYKIKMEEQRSKLREYYETIAKITQESFLKRINLLEESKIKAEQNIDVFQQELIKKSLDFNRIKLDNESISIDMQKKSKEIEEIRLEVQKKIMENETVKTDLEKKTKENESLKSELKKKSKENETLYSELQKKNKKNEEELKLKSEIEQYKLEIQNKSKEIEEYKLELEKITKESKESKLESEKKIEELEKDIEILRGKNLELKENITNAAFKFYNNIKATQFSPAPQKDLKPSHQISFNDTKMNKKRPREEPRTPLTNLTNKKVEPPTKEVNPTRESRSTPLKRDSIPKFPFTACVTNRTRAI